MCRHNDGAPAVSLDQFWEQTYIKQGKGAGGLKGISTNEEQVMVWVNSFSICSHVSLAMDDMYSSVENEMQEDDVDGTVFNKKKEGKKRMTLDRDDRGKILEELMKYSHPVQAESDNLYNIVNGQCAPPIVNVHNTVDIGKTSVFIQIT